MPLIALEFEDHQILVTCANAGKDRLTVTDLTSIDTQQRGAEAIGEAIKIFLQSTSASRGEAIAIVPRAWVEIRELTVPPAPAEELPDMIRFQARKEFASLGDQWALDYVELGSPQPDEPRRVLAAALTPKFTDLITEVCKTANLKLQRILLKPFAAVELLDSVTADGNLRLVVDQDLETTDLSIVQGTQLLTTRTVRIPSALSADKRNRQLISEVRRTLAFAQAAAEGRKVTDVVISGEEARNRNLAGDLSGPLGLKVQFFQPLSEVQVATRVDDSNARQLGNLMSTLGGIKKEISGARPAIDFLNPRRPVVKHVNYTKYWCYAAIAAGLVFLSAFYAWWTLAQQANDIEQMRSNLARAMRINEGDENTPSVEQRLAEIGKIDQWKLQEVNWLVELSEFSKRYLLPDDVIADSLNASLRNNGAATMDLSGRIVDDLAKTNELLKALGERPYSVEPIDTGVDTDDRDSKLTSTFEYQIKLQPSGNSGATHPMLELDRAALNYLKQKRGVSETQ